jgi:hypothetical protein
VFCNSDRSAAISTTVPQCGGGAADPANADHRIADDGASDGVAQGAPMALKSSAEVRLGPGRPRRARLWSRSHAAGRDWLCAPAGRIGRATAPLAQTGRKWAGWR